ncbi:MAG: amidophosphoribosyltransferase [Acidobacteria bacterium]|jgi:amidophosphoribosyltransferase|nr:amidophosphoribosyltransferase [Acidobacteriota bacterium]
MCGVLGIFSTEPVVARMYAGLLTLQHRGQDSAGILTYDGRFHEKKGNGLVRDIFDEHNISRLQGAVGLGHTRYPTVGAGSGEDAQPFWVNRPYGIAAAHNGNVVNFFELKKELFEKSHKIINSNCDVEVILNVFAEGLERSSRREVTAESVFSAIRHVYKRVKGAYSVVIYIADKGMVAFRDPYGVRPLLFGCDRRQMLPDYGFASESVTLDLLGFGEIRDVPPGSAIFIDANRAVHEARLQAAPFKPCIFEYIYFARPDSYLNKINVYQARVDLGRTLARTIQKSGLPIDVVVPVPDSSRPAAIEIARLLKLKYREGLVKNRYIGRTFIMPGDSVRRRTIRQKLNPIVDVFQGQRVLIVDDSIVRGNTSRSIIQMVRQSGARSVYFVSYSAPLTYPCVYGIDMQTRSEFIASGAGPEEIAARIGADRVIYQDRRDMERAVRRQNPAIRSFCTACFSGEYPTGDVSRVYLEQIEQEREELRRRQKELALKF